MTRLALLICLFSLDAGARNPRNFDPRDVTPLASTTLTTMHISPLEIAGLEAENELALCARQALPLFGDVTVAFPWKATASKSLGPRGAVVEACALAAIQKHSDRDLGRDGAMPAPFTFEVGKAEQILPPIATFMPIWRAALGANATKAERDAFKRLVPADYRIHGRCLVTQRQFANKLEPAWLAGLPRLEFWRFEIEKLIGREFRDGAWDGTGFVTSSIDGLCADPFEPVAAKQAFTRAGSCLAGSPTEMLLSPHIEFPPGTYTQVVTQADRACALTSTGTVTCCGATGLAAAPKKTFTQIALGNDFACALDSNGSATCWGRVNVAPKVKFTQLVAGRWRVCGIHGDNTVECWSDKATTVRSPKGAFSTIALADAACGIHTDGEFECWDDAQVTDVPNVWKTLSVDDHTLCGIRAARSVGCWDDNYKAVSTIDQGKWQQLAVTQNRSVCGVALDGTIQCHDLAHHRNAPAPKGTFTQITSDRDQFCALGSKIACWGDMWPRAERARVPATAMHGTVVDDAGLPIANATVAIDSKSKHDVKTASDGTWSSADTRDSRVTFSAPGRETVSIYGETDAFVSVTLRRAAPIAIDAVCDGKPCDYVTTEVGHMTSERNSLENMPPGVYRLQVWISRGFDHERFATVDVEMPFDARPLTIHVEPKPTGTGQAIRGTVTTSIAELPQWVELRCAHDLNRRAYLDQHGAFAFADAPPLPCKLEAGGGDFETKVTEIKTYGDHLTISLARR